MEGFRGARAKDRRRNETGESERLRYVYGRWLEETNVDCSLALRCGGAEISGPLQEPSR